LVEENFAICQEFALLIDRSTVSDKVITSLSYALLAANLSLCLRQTP